MTTSSFSRLPRSARGALIGALLVTCVLPVAAPVSAAAALDIVAVLPPVSDGPVAVVADVRPPAASPIPSSSFAVTQDGSALSARAVPIISDQTVVGVVLDASTAGASSLQAGLGGIANFLLQLPVAVRVAVVADTTPPAVLARLRAGAKDALSAVDAVSGGGGRSTSRALTLALSELAVAPDGPRLVVLVTAAANAGGEAAADLARRLRSAHALVGVVTTNADDTYWSRVAAGTGGVLMNARATDPLTAFETMANTLRARYLLTFPVRGRLPARVTIRVDTPGGTSSADAYIAGSGGSPADRGGSQGGPVWPGILGAAAVLAIVAAVLLRRRARSRSGPDRPVPTGSGTRPPTPAVAGDDDRALAPGTRTAPAGQAAPGAGGPVPDRGRRAGPSPDAVGTTTRPAAVPLTGERRRRPAMPIRPSGEFRAEAAAETARGEDDQAAYAALDGEVDAVAAAVDGGRMGRRQAIARIALAAPGRTDLLDRLVDTERRLAGSQLAGSAPSEIVLDLLASARQIIVGAATIAGPEGVRVEQTAPAGADRISRTVLRLTRNGHWVCDCRTADELGRHVDVSTLVAGPGAL